MPFLTGKKIKASKKRSEFSLRSWKEVEQQGGSLRRAALVTTTYNANGGFHRKELN